MKIEQEIFRKGSTTYYWSSRFFPRKVRDDVFKLYSFVRVVDDLVDTLPQDVQTFNAVGKAWRSRSLLTNNTVVGVALRNIFELEQKYHFDPQWVEAFLQSMQWDIDERQYKNQKDSLQYVYGSAEVIGLMMARILELPEQAATGAQMQGRAMQWINFCRDISEDLDLGRCYFPQSELRRFGLSDLQPETVKRHKQSYLLFMKEQLKLYREWQLAADESYQYLPWRLRIPVRTASRMYLWTAQQIENDPFVVYRHKVKPSKQLIIAEAFRSMFRA